MGAIIKSKAKTKSPFLSPILVFCCVVFGDIMVIAYAALNAVAVSTFPLFSSIFALPLLLMVGYCFWQWQQERERVEALVERIKALHAQAGTRLRHLPSSPSRYCYYSFAESLNWEFRIDRELNALERQRGMRVPRSQRRMFSTSNAEVLSRFSQRVEALEGARG